MYNTQYQLGYNTLIGTDSFDTNLPVISKLVSKGLKFIFLKLTYNEFKSLQSHAPSMSYYVFGTLQFII